MKTTAIHFDSPLTTAPINIREVLRSIGIEEVTANVFSLPTKLPKSKKHQELAMQ